MKILLIGLFILFNLSISGQSRKVCFSMDDMPVVNYGITDSVYQQNLFAKLVHSFSINHVPAIGFVNEKKLHNQDGLVSFQLDMLQSWVTAGFDLGNHTYSHPDYNQVSFEYYTQDLVTGEPVLRKILKEQGKELKYFRHPFLHVGNTKAKADSLDEFLKQHAYTVAPVTIDNEDYLFASAYHKARLKGDTVLMTRIGIDYIMYMERKMHYYEQQSNRMFGRDIPQVLLIHASKLNADYLDSLINLFRENGYTFVSMDEVLKDPVYETPILVYGNWGISWMDKWALSAGKKGDFFKDDPVVPDYINKE